MQTSHLTIAVMSDLHCRHGKESQISTHLYTESPRNPKEQHPIESLKKLIDSEQLHSDILLCPGDIADKADNQGLLTGWDYVKEIARYLKCSFLTASVGNHDVKSRSYDGTAFEYLVSFVDDYPIDNKFLKECFWSATKNYFIHSEERYIILNFNSAFSHTNVDNAKKSIISDTILSSMKGDLKDLESSEKIKVALCHHHPKEFANSDELYKDYDKIERGGEFLRILADTNFDLVIHGHKHIPRLDYFGESLPIFCSGSFSSLENIKDISGKNTFHLIKISKNDTQSVGEIRTWEFIKGQGWQKATTENFFPWLTGFGADRNMENLRNKINAIVFANSEDVLYYDELLLQVSELKYLTPAEQRKLTKLLLDQNGIEFVPGLANGTKFVSKQVK